MKTEWAGKLTSYAPTETTIGYKEGETLIKCAERLALHMFGKEKTPKALICYGESSGYKHDYLAMWGGKQYALVLEIFPKRKDRQIEQGKPKLRGKSPCKK